MPFLHSMIRKITGPRSRVTDEQKSWIEGRLRWLQKEFGTDRVKLPVLHPNAKIFPRAWNATTGECLALFHELCEYMEVPAASVRLKFYRGTKDPLRQHLPAYESAERGAAGMFHGKRDRGTFLISVAAEQLDKPAALVATLCHELGHVLLLGERRLSGDEEDHEPLTDLLTIYFGAGIFTANSAFQFEQWQDGQYQGWQASRHGYMTEPELAYSLAAYAWLRGESNPVWRNQLEPNITPYFNDALHFIFTTRQTSLIRSVG